ncbi:DoxX family membrane protein [Ancrocorticia populi]|uniref:DoxX family membrane protein n=1 Tax=Ancrocorticia populi TaxID=2175228 RepID=UPI003F9A4FCC
MSIMRALARPLLATPFAASGADALLKPAGHRERARIFEPIADKAGIELTDKNLDLATRALGITQILGAAGLATGKFPRFSAAVLAAVQVPLALANNPVWLHTGAARREDLAGLATSAGLIGGAGLAAADLAGKPSLGWRRANRSAQRHELRAAREKERTASANKIAKLQEKNRALAAKSKGKLP